MFAPFQSGDLPRRWFFLLSGYQTDGAEVNRVNHLFLLEMRSIMAAYPEMIISGFAPISDQQNL
jgi:hypothetical protein